MTDIQIPPEALEAFDEADNGCDCRDCKAKAIRAALNAWPGGIINPMLGRLILPLTEKANADNNP